MSLIGSSMSGGNLVPSSSSKNCRSPLCRKVFFIVHIVKSNFTFYKSCCLGFLNVRAEYARGGGARSGRSGRLFSFSQTLPNRKPRGAWKWVIERPASWAGGLSRYYPCRRNLDAPRGGGGPTALYQVAFKCVTKEAEKLGELCPRTLTSFGFALTHWTDARR